MNRWTIASLLLFLLLLPVASHGQGYCELKQIKVEQVTNGLLIHLPTTGLMEAWYWGNFWRFSPTKRITFILNKVRSGADSIVEIGQYPVSHLEFSRPTDLGPGEDRLNCTLVMYTPSRLTAFEDRGDVSGTMSTDIPQVMISLTQQRNELLIMVMSNRPQEPPRAQVGDGAAPQLEVSGTREKLKLHAVNTEFHTVIEAISQYTGVPIYLDDRVQQHVTAYLEDLSLARILRSLATGYGLSVSWRDEAFYLSSGKPTSGPSYWAATSRTLPLRYLSPEEAQALLPDAILSQARPNSGNQTINITGSPQIVDKIEHDLRTLDTPGYQVRVRAWIISCQGTNDKLRTLMATATGGNTQVEADSTGRMAIQLSGGDPQQILAQLHAMAQQMKMRIETTPEIAVTNGDFASLFVGKDIYYWQLAGTTLQLSSVKVGSRLDIQPRTSGEWITTYVRVDDNYLREINALGPMIIKQSINSTIRMRSGDSLLIGGLQITNQDRQHGRVLPSWMPGGELFSRQAANETMNEVWVLVQAEASQALATRQPKAEDRQ